MRLSLKILNQFCVRTQERWVYSLNVLNLSIKGRYRAKIVEAHKDYIILLMQSTTLQKWIATNSSCQNAYYCCNFTGAQYVNMEPLSVKIFYFEWSKYHCQIVVEAITLQVSSKMD